MRLISLGFAAAAAVGLALATSPANAMTAPPPAGLQLAVEDMQPFETVHCRRFRHRHRYGHGWSRGCRDGVVIIVPGERRRGYRERTRVRGPVGIETRSRAKTETRSKGDITVKGKADVKAKGPDTNIRTKGSMETKGSVETKGAPTKTGVETKKGAPAVK